MERTQTAIASLLVPLSGGPNCRGALRTALAVARAFDARVDALHVRINAVQAIPAMAEGVTSVLVDQLMDSIEARVAERSKAAGAIYQELCLDAAPEGLRSNLTTLDGRAEATIAQRGRLADLIVFEAFDEDDGADYPINLEAALFETGRPVLLAPPSGVDSLGSKVLLAWNDTVESARAMAAALPFLAGAESVTAVTVRDRCDADPEDVLAYLKDHAIDATARNLKPDYRPVGEQLQDEAVAAGADLLVMGAYSHSRLRELVLGGVTESITKAPRVPVFMAH